MRTDLSHLPERKRRDLDDIVRIIRALANVEMIVLYGSYARGDWSEARHLSPQSWSGHPSDYDILIVVADRAQAEDTQLWYRVTDALRGARLSAPCSRTFFRRRGRATALLPAVGPGLYRQSIPRPIQSHARGTGLFGAEGKTPVGRH